MVLTKNIYRLKLPDNLLAGKPLIDGRTRVLGRPMEPI
ncbi:MAG: hypothetical protein CM1200mP20_07700 [Pseudomonadota bacterium]|nr:MAG: hypothetical protein CM1200mP20_07700 [Pseudomonadota bacterium]